MPAHDHLTSVAAAFMPHGHCWAWTPGILWMMVLGNLLVALAYYSIPVVLFRLVRGRRDLPYPHLFVLFGLFILFCGTGHVVDIVTIWHPVYWFDAIWDLGTGLISIATAIVLWPLLPRLMRAGAIEEIVQRETIAQLEEKNAALADANARHASDNAALQEQVAAIQRATELLAQREERIAELRAELAKLRGDAG